MSREVRNSLLGRGLAMTVISPALYVLDRLELQDLELPVEEVLRGSSGLAAIVALGGVAAYFKK